jgi:hypothetical protein
MFNTTTHISQSATPSRVAFVVGGAAAINALVFSPLGDQGFFAIALLGPILSGFAAAISARDVRLVAAAWALSGLFWLVFDWAVNQEDVAFHLVLTVLMAGLTALGGKLGARRVHPRVS